MGMRKATLYVLALAASLLLAASCASIGTPSGGPRDEDPPRFVTSNPLQGAVEVTPGKVILTFDELVTLKDAFSKVVVSPPGAQAPRVSSLGRRVTVEFRDTLLPETTYTIDFGDAIADNNEGNKLENFIYTFSTGPVLDTLMVSGMVLGAEDLAPAEGMYVGLHRSEGEMPDTAFRTRRFERVAKTDGNGKFVIGGLAPGSYRVYALEDKDGDLAWSSPEESLAFYDELVVPEAEQTVTTDTLFNLLTGAVDSVITRTRTRFLPNNVLLRSFNTGYRQQYITKNERQDSTRINLIFNAAADSMPAVTLLLPGGGERPIAEVAVAERSATNDTLTFWLRDRDLIALDTLRAAVGYLRADSAYNMVAVSDTLRLITQRPKVREKKNVKEEKTDTVPLPAPVMEIKALVSRPEIGQPLVLELPEPPDSVDFSMMRLEWKEDTIWQPVKGFGEAHMARDSLNPRRIRVEYPWNYETTYRFTVDSLAARSIYGPFSDDLRLDFTIRPETEYGSLKFNLSNMGPDSVARYVELLDAQGKPLRKLPLEGDSVTFSHLLPAKYNVRVVEDLDGDMRWSPGDFDRGVQPDRAYYYKETVELKANWDQEIDWNVFGTPVDRMVPESLRKKSNNNRR